MASRQILFFIFLSTITLCLRTEDRNYLNRLTSQMEGWLSIKRLASQPFAHEATPSFSETPSLLPPAPALEEDLVSVSSDTIAGIRIELRYATIKNITGHKIYKKDEPCLVAACVHEALKNVQEELAQLGYGLVIWDAYQSPEAQQKIWDLVPHDTLIENPSIIKNKHAQGLAVDVTLYSVKTGRKIPMPTDFDNISICANSKCKALPLKILLNRDLLAYIMVKHGFNQTSSSPWWHFEYQGHTC